MEDSGERKGGWVWNSAGERGCRLGWGWKGEGEGGKEQKREKEERGGRDLGEGIGGCGGEKR